MATPIGIDLGTTYSAVATINRSGQPEIVHNSEGQPITPSVVLFDDGEAIVGQQAKLQRAAFPDDVVEFVKRQMGDDTWKFYPTVGDPYTPEGISAIILRRLAADTSLVLGVPVKEVVITVPAYFTDAQRKATKDAGEIAGLQVLSVINEPTAAAVSFGVEHDFNGTVLVYDLGGGTFDVTLLRVLDGDFDIVRTDGDKNLGGFDFDNAIIAWIKAEFAARTGETVDDEAQLRDRAEQAKHRLTQAERAPIFVSAAGRNERLILDRATFEEIAESLLAKTEMLVADVVADAGLSFDAIDKVLLVGGSSRMPMVAEMLTRLAGHAPDQSVHPDEAVAKGAAIVAALRGDSARGSGGTSPTPVTPSGHALGISDVVSHGLGVVIVDDVGREINSVIFPANTKIPDQKSEIYSTISDSQTALHVRVTEGEEEELRYVKILGDSTLTIPPYPRGAPLEVIFSCDIDGILHIEVVDRTSHESLGEFEIERTTNLDQGEIDRMREAVDRLEIE